MIVNYEFLGDEPIENVITCMHFNIDKVVFLGYREVIERQRRHTERFLKDYCGVSEVTFVNLPQNNLSEILDIMCSNIADEQSLGNRVYFDVTGGESLVLVAFGMIAERFGMPMHVFDIWNDRIIELDSGAPSSILEDVEYHKMEMNLDTFIAMHGGVINYSLHKDIKNIGELDQDTYESVWQVASQNWGRWNAFSHIVRQKKMAPNSYLTVNVKGKTIRGLLANCPEDINTETELQDMLDVLSEAGILINVDYSNDHYRFTYASEILKSYIWDAGSILELNTFLAEVKGSDDCMLGVHIDWDGQVHEKENMDVVNEIDVLRLNGNIPTFISCKAGKLHGEKAHNAMYELETVASEFGGKYCHKVLKCVYPVPAACRDRAKEMNIQIQYK